ncbi:MAG: FMN-binding negative transcriptional regulator [Oceanococcaceae bacterium]
MYTPRSFEETSAERILQCVRANAFGMLVSTREGRPQVSHLPFVWDAERRSFYGHLARANPHWQDWEDGQEVLLVFQGPHAYVSPSWYEGPGVPTWNYAVVHARGRVQLIHEAEPLHRIVMALSQVYESGQPQPWEGVYEPRLLDGIVGLEVRLTELKASFKLSQNRSAADRQTVMTQLSAEGPSEANRVAQMMAENEQALLP